VEFKDQRIVVAGASGFIGSHLLEYLCQSGATVLALARNIERMVNVHCQGKLQLVSCDLSDRDLVMPLMREFNPNIVFHLASQPDAEEGFDQANLTLGVNAHCTLNLLEGFAECPGAEVFVYGDSTKVYGVQVRHIRVKRRSYLIARMPSQKLQVGITVIYLGD
jgi:nucleoside-diphosphate-sugar epimerase